MDEELQRFELVLLGANIHIAIHRCGLQQVLTRIFPDQKHLHCLYVAVKGKFPMRRWYAPAVQLCSERTGQ